MRAAIKGGKERFDIIEVDTPSPGPNECLVRIHYCAICVWCYREWLRDDTDQLYPPGLTGHEMSGVIEAVGDIVTDWKAGDRVLTYAASHCGECAECRAGRSSHCLQTKKAPSVLGGYAEYVSAHTNCLFPAPDGIDLKEASMITDMVGTPMHAIRRAFRLDLPKAAVGVWGLGPVGLFTVQGLRTYAEVGKIIALDPVGYRRELASGLGADEVLDPLAEGILDLLRKQNDGQGMDYAFNCALKNPQDAYDTLRKGGFLMNITGGIKTQGETDKTVDGTWYFDHSEYPANIDMVKAGKFDLAGGITHEFPLADINTAFEVRAKHPEESLKVVIRCID
ncbi:zinc-binding dehydrogenase [Planctomycetota bacterium]